MSITLSNSKVKYKLLYEIDKYLDNLHNTKNSKYFLQPIYFYNGLNHNNLCLYTSKNLRKNVLDYLDNRFKMNTTYLIWKNLYDDIYINEYTGIIKFTNLNNSSSCRILLTMLEEKKEYLSENTLILNAIIKNYNES